MLKTEQLKKHIVENNGERQREGRGGEGKEEGLTPFCLSPLQTTSPTSSLERRGEEEGETLISFFLLLVPPPLTNICAPISLWPRMIAAAISLNKII